MKKTSINHISWWAQELPSDEEYAEARRNLDAVGWQVDYIITHCAPTSIALMGSRHNEADRLTDFLQDVRERARYHYWLFGHYHDNRAMVLSRFMRKNVCKTRLNEVSRQ